MKRMRNKKKQLPVFRELFRYQGKEFTARN